MNIEACIEFGKAIDLQQVTVDRRGGWINSRCPMPWHHEHGDRHPSFGIKAVPDGPSIWNCFSYGAGTLYRLLHTLQFHHGVHYLEASDILTSNEIILDQGSRQWQEYNDKYQDILIDGNPENIPPIPEYVLSQFPSVLDNTKEAKQMLQFLMKTRGISREVLKKFDVRYAPELNAVIFPVRDTKGRLMYMRARCRDSKIIFEISPEHANVPEMSFPGKGRSGAMFGDHFIDFKKPVLVVESEPEALKLITMGCKNTIAACGGLSNSQLRKLVYPILLSGFDSDQAGKNSEAKLVKKCKDYSRVYVVDWSKVGANDPGDLKSVDQLKKALKLRKNIL